MSGLRRTGLLVAFLLTTLFILPQDATAQRKKRENHLLKLISLQAELLQEKARPGDVVKLKITGQVKDGWHIYPITKFAPGQIQKTEITYKHTEALKPLPPIQETEPALHKATDGSMVLDLRGKVEWTQDILVDPKAKPGKQELEVILNIQVCDEKFCYPATDYPPLTVKLDVAAAEGAVTLPPEIQERLARAAERKWIAGVAVVEAKPAAPQRPPVTSTAVDRTSLWGLLGSAAIGALLMLLTPCVFPMIPITVNFFLKQSEQEHHNPLLSASVYSGTIILLLTGVILVFGSLVIELANNAWFNLALGFVLIYFAFSLFGMYEVELPSFLTQWTSAREGQGGLVGAVFMALTFTITSFTCTGPFLGALMAPVAGLQPPYWQLALAALVYSTVFAAPFFVLALFPTLLKALPKSGGWLNAIKVTMGFLELGAALKFLANTDIAFNPGNPWIFNYDTVLCAWIALCVACGLYLIGVFRLPHDHGVDHIGVVRMVFASIFLGLSIYMSPLLFGVKPAGIVADALVAFLPPSFREVGPAGSHSGELAWTKNYEEAWSEATKEKKLILIDFTGVNCTNCRYNEKNIFPNPRVRELMQKYARVALYTDVVPERGLSPAEAKEQARRNFDWQTDIVEDVTLPTYVIFQADTTRPFTADGALNGKVLGRTGGTINDVSQFITFLQQPLEHKQDTKIALQQ